MAILSKMNFSFSGCGFIGIYHVGVASCIKQYASYAILDKIAGASAGSLAACALLCRVDLGRMTTTILQAAVEARKGTLGPFQPGFDINKVIYNGLNNLLPSDAHLICDGHLYVSVTRVRDGKNVLISRFPSRDDLIQALICSCFIPFFSGYTFPQCMGEGYVDGGLSNNLPRLDEHTVTVSPFAGECDICPQDNCCDLLQVNLANTSINVSTCNVYRLSKTIFPPESDVLDKICKQGFDDALKFLQRNSLITCTRHLAIQTSIHVGPEEAVEVQIQDDCRECRQRKHVALGAKLPESVCSAIQEAADQVNKGAFKWLLRHGSVQLVLLPVTLPLDITILLFCKVWDSIPELQKAVHNLTNSGWNFLNDLYKIFNKGRQHYSAKLSCQLALTEYDYELPSKVATSPSHLCTPLPRSQAPSQPNLDRRPSRPIKRMSYAGQPSVSAVASRGRRHSMAHMDPERCIDLLSYNVTFNVGDSGDQGREILSMLQKAKAGNPIQPTEVTARALSWEKDYVDQCRPESRQALHQYCNMTAQSPVMSYYYVDGANGMNVTEIYKVEDQS